MCTHSPLLSFLAAGHVYPGPASHVINMQSKAQVSAAFFMQDELRNDILARNELINSIESDGQGTKLATSYSRKCALLIALDSFCRYTSGSGKLSLAVFARVGTAAHEAGTVVHVPGNACRYRRQVLPAASSWLVCCGCSRFPSKLNDLTPLTVVFFSFARQVSVYSPPNVCRWWISGRSCSTQTLCSCGKSLPRKLSVIIVSVVVEDAQRVSCVEPIV